MRYGIQVTAKPGSMEQSDLLYDSTKNHLQTYLKGSPEHMGILELNYTGTNFVAGTGHQEETLLSVEHKLGYVPRCQVYIQVLDAPAAMASWIGQYPGSQFLLSATSPYEDYLYYRVTDTTFSIVHTYEAGGTFPNSVMQSYKFKIKWMIQPINRFLPRTTVSQTNEAS